MFNEQSTCEKPSLTGIISNVRYDLLLLLTNIRVISTQLNIGRLDGLLLEVVYLLEELLPIIMDVTLISLNFPSFSERVTYLMGAQYFLEKSAIRWRFSRRLSGSPSWLSS